MNSSQNTVRAICLGTHLSVSNGYVRMAQDAVRIGAETLQCFIRNPRGARAKAAVPAEMKAFRTFLAEHSLVPIVVHAAYTMNLCSANEQTRELSEKMLAEDLARMTEFPGNFYNLHPGSRILQPMDTAVRMIAGAINRVLPRLGDTTILLETMAGKGSEVGGSFQELAEILSLVDDPSRVGICMDSCHMWDAGYDIVNDLDGVLTAFDQAVGLSRLRAFHINDSMSPRGSHRDRHAMCGEGQIGLEAIRRMLTHPALCRLPFILETPADTEGHAAEIAMLKTLCGY